jgi:hypothetical protein
VRCELLADDEQGGNTPEYTKRELPAALKENLWQPGQSGNPSGRPKKKPITELYERMLADPQHLAAIELSVARALKRGQMAMVLHLREMTDRVEGKVTQPIQAELTINLADAVAAGRKRAAERAAKRQGSE